jgi:hypothetical protein
MSKKFVILTRHAYYSLFAQSINELLTDRAFPPVCVSVLFLLRKLLNICSRNLMLKVYTKSFWAVLFNFASYRSNYMTPSRNFINVLKIITIDFMILPLHLKHILIW